MSQVSSGCTTAVRDTLNPTLFSALSRRFGEVEVVSAGVAINWGLELSEASKRRTLEGDPRKPRLSRKVLYSGEEYRLRCPFCRDHRARLYINHRWGVWDEETGSYNLFLAQCFNEQCLTDWDRQKQLYDWVYALEGQMRRQVAVKPGTYHDPTKLQEMAPPGFLIRLDELQREDPKHRAIQYLLSRGLDPNYLGVNWQVSYCARSRYSLASDRIIVPIYMGGMLVGWQARYIGDSVQGVPFNKAGVPKYWTSPGLPRRMVAYNYDTAVRHSLVVLVEGPADVWAGGPWYAALLGKTMSQQLATQFAADLRRNHGDKASVFVMLDPKPDPVALKRGRPHHIEKLYQQLLPIFRHRLGKIYLPENTDPGSLDREFLRRLVRQEGKKQGITVKFSRPI